MKIKFACAFLIIYAFTGVSVNSLFAQNGGKVTIAGQLLKSNGKPLAYTEIELVPVAAKKIVIDGRLLATSSTSGKFSFVNVPDGKYTLSINFDDKPTDLSPYPTFFYPNVLNRADAEVFEIKNGGKIRTVLFQLPPALVKRKVTGRIVGTDGERRGGAFIFIRDIDFDTSYGFGQTRSDGAGNFSFVAFTERKYQCGAILFEELPAQNGLPVFGEILAAGETEIFTPALNMTSIKLILKESKRDNRIKDKYVGKSSRKRNEAFQNS